MRYRQSKKKSIPKIRIVDADIKNVVKQIRKKRITNSFGLTCSVRPIRLTESERRILRKKRIERQKLTWTKKRAEMESLNKQKEQNVLLVTTSFDGSFQPSDGRIPPLPIVKVVGRIPPLKRKK